MNLLEYMSVGENENRLTVSLRTAVFAPYSAQVGFIGTDLYFEAE